MAEAPASQPSDEPSQKKPPFGGVSMFGPGGIPSLGKPGGKPTVGKPTGKPDVSTSDVIVKKPEAKKAPGRYHFY